MLDFFIHYGYIGLFLASFLAATILPFGSEAVFAALLAAGLGAFPCIVVGTLGSSLGGVTNYYLGRLGKTEWIEKYLRVKEEKILATQVWIDRKGGAYLAFFSFLPFFGDVIPLALGFMKANFWKVALSMTVGKMIRYIALLFLMNFIGHYFHILF
ncbi:MAG: DedA family protein [Tannerellaceae bacterium]|jgi:membrane protein YqaA with SNARE-associated domain|nr:DedA family protein [Tannerellaceae bacterium]